MKVIISTGLGRLHLVQSALSLQKAGVDVSIIQGWLPRRIPVSLLNLLGILIGHKNLAAGMSKRYPAEIVPARNYSCASAEFYTQALFILAKFGLFPRSWAASIGWQHFGRCSRKFLYSADIFHVRSGAGQGEAISSARQKGMKVVVDHSIAHPAFMELMLTKEYERYGLPFELGPINALWKLVLQDCQKADVLLVNSDFVKQTFVEQGYPAEKIEVNYLGVRTDFMGLKRNYDLLPTINLLFTGGFGIRKGAEYLLAALNILEEKQISYRMNIVGTWNEAKILIEKFRFKEKLNLVGHLPQDELKSYLSEADIYVFPTLAEGCASSAMEAMAAGLPVITTRESGLPINHGEDGWLIPAKDADSLANAIIKLKGEINLRQALGSHAARKIAENYTWERYGQNITNFYKELLK